MCSLAQTVPCWHKSVLAEDTAVEVGMSAAGHLFLQRFTVCYLGTITMLLLNTS